MNQAGIYARISVAGEGHCEESIDNQILLAREWIKKRQEYGEEFEEYCCYTDRGYSGSNFQRPAFRKMLKDAEAGTIQCIICKDASRLGRDYLQVGMYMEQIFPLWGVRLVCVSEGYDSRDGLPGSLAGCLRNLMNEWYAKDIGRRVRLVKEQKRRQGEYLGSRPPYGYQICVRDGRRVLEEEPETILVVNKIALWRREGMSYACIQRRLREEGINPPAVYRSQGSVFSKEVPAPDWDFSTIRYVIKRFSHTRGDYHPA